VSMVHDGREVLMILTVNKLKTARAWDEASNFDSDTDKTKFRQYEEACDRVKSFYKEQHGPFFCS
jgi:hypothetical protein